MIVVSSWYSLFAILEYRIEEFKLVRLVGEEKTKLLRCLVWCFEPSPCLAPTSADASIRRDDYGFSVAKQWLKGLLFCDNW